MSMHDPRVTSVPVDWLSEKSTITSWVFSHFALAVTHQTCAQCQGESSITRPYRVFAGFGSSRDATPIRRSTHAPYIPPAARFEIIHHYESTPVCAGCILQSQLSDAPAVTYTPADQSAIRAAYQFAVEQAALLERQKRAAAQTAANPREASPPSHTARLAQQVRTSKLADLL